MLFEGGGYGGRQVSISLLVMWEVWDAGTRRREYEEEHGESQSMVFTSAQQI